MESQYMTTDQLAARWGGAVSPGTLANWRSQGFGPPFVKLRGRVLYPIDKVIEWEAVHMSAVQGKEAA